MNPSAPEFWTAASGFAAAVGALAAWVRWVRPKLHKTRSEVVAVRDSILGRDAITDSITGQQIAPAIPGVGVRMAEQERQMGILTEAVAKIADSHVRLEDHESRIVKLEQAAVERVVARAESAQAYRAMEAAIKATPDDEDN